MSEPARIVLLNGAGSVGKSAIAKALQTIASGWYLHVAMDAFLDMLPGRYFGDPDGMVFETIEDGGKPSILIHTGPVVERALAGIRHAVAALTAEGNNLIVDDVYMAAEAAEYDRLLAPFRVHRVGMFAPLAVRAPAPRHALRSGARYIAPERDGVRWADQGGVRALVECRQFRCALASRASSQSCAMRRARSEVN